MASNRASMSGVATRVRARTLAYDSSPRASAWASRGSVAQGAGHADLLAGRAEIEADAPGEPLGTGPKAGVPAAAGIEVPDQIEQARGGRVEVRRELGDRIAEALELGR